MKWVNLKSELNALFPGKAEVIKRVKQDPHVVENGSFAVDEDLAKEIKKIPTPEYNEMHGLVVDEPHWGDDPVVLKYRTARYTTIKALRARGRLPPALSACALVCNTINAEIVLRRRSATVDKYKNSLHIFGGNFRAEGDKVPDADLGHTLRRELDEEADLLTGTRLSRLNCERVLARETCTGFIQLAYLGIDFPPEQVDYAVRVQRKEGEGRPVQVKFSELEERLCNPDERWVHSGQLLILLWLALGAPTARVDGGPSDSGFDGTHAQEMYRRVVPRLMQRNDESVRDRR